MAEVETQLDIDLRDDFLRTIFCGAVCIHHIDITCDGCEAEPIIGKRFKCQKCEDIDLCETCMRALIAARVEMSQQAGPLPEPPLQSQRPRHWIAKLRSEDGNVKWAALQAAVPCLHASHTFCQVTGGPERALVLSVERPREAQQDAGIDNQLIQKFLDSFPPSKCECSDLAWLICDITTPQEGGTTKAPLDKDLESRVEAAIDDWERIVHQRKPTSNDVNALARRHRIRCGKWMIFPRTAADSDAAWQAVVLAATSGTLGCTQIKISSNNPREKGHVLMAYTEDYLDKKEVDEAAEGLRAALPLNLKDAKLLYKADITTYLGIYAKNEYNIKPTIYTDQL